MIFDESELGADAAPASAYASAMPSPLTAAVVRPQERAFDVTYDIGGACGRLIVYATNWLSAIEQATCDIADEQHMMSAQISVRPMP